MIEKNQNAWKPCMWVYMKPIQMDAKCLYYKDGRVEKSYTRDSHELCVTVANSDLRKH